MADRHHDWRLGEDPPIIRAHSLAKHRVVDQYLRRYVSVLTANLRIPALRLTLIDGFAGGGAYRHWKTNEVRFGSPLLMLHAMRDAAVEAQFRRKKEFTMDLEYIFVEESVETFPYLKEQIGQSEFKNLVPDKIKLINGTFSDQVEKIVEYVRNRRGGSRAIFLLDQFGYKDVPFPLLRHILSHLNQAEIILTFATDFLIDYLNEEDWTQKRLSEAGIDLSKEDIASAKQKADTRCAIQTLLHRQIPDKSGAGFYTPFFIRSPDANKDYWLIHLSNHSRARDVMVGLHWQEKTCFAHYGKPGLEMLGYNPKEDPKISGHTYLFDEEAEGLTKESLVTQLPRRLDRSGISFSRLFATLTNETPATSDIIKEALATLLRDGEIEIRGDNGSVSRRNGVHHKNDIIKRSEQPTYFFLSKSD